MIMVKKIIALSAAFVFTLSLAGFGLSTEGTVSAENQKAPVQRQEDPSFTPDIPVVEDITLEELVASGAALPVAENVSEEIVELPATRSSIPTYYASSSDVGWKRGSDGTSWYYYNSSNQLVYGWLFYTDVNGVSGWYFLRMSDGKMYADRTAQIEGYWYYFQTSGLMKTGWQYINNDWYYFYPSTGVQPQGSAAIGFVQVGTEIYHFGSTGVMDHGKTYVTAQNGYPEGYYYLGYPGDSDSGGMMYGWLHDIEVSDSTWYYLDPVRGRAYMGWYDISGDTYHFDGEAVMSSGDVRMGYSDFEFTSDGELVDDGPYEKADGSLNLRWGNLLLDGSGHRVASIRANKGNLTGNLYSAFTDMVSYYSLNAKGDNDNVSLVSMSMVSSASSADLVVCSLSEDEWLNEAYGTGLAAITLTCNENGGWANGDRPPEEYDKDYFSTHSEYVTSKIDYAVIALRESEFVGKSENYYKNVMRHEMGHVIGLRHPWETSDYNNNPALYPSGPACLMYPVSNTNWLTFQDYDLEELYMTYPQRGATPDE